MVSANQWRQSGKFNSILKQGVAGMFLSSFFFVGISNDFHVMLGNSEAWEKGNSLIMHLFLCFRKWMNVNQSCLS